jgi:acyl-CoA synthetase (AMP-forming)/AMP-acid ligase II
MHASFCFIALKKYFLFSGQKVAFLTPNSSQYVVAQWAVWMCGGVVVPLCQSHPLDTLRYLYPVPYVPSCDFTLFLPSSFRKNA